MKKKVMISQSMKDKTEEEISKERNKIIKKYLPETQYEVINTIFTEFASKNSPVKCLAKSIDALADVDLVIFAPGWEYARGCRIEYRIAKDYGIALWDLNLK